MHNSKHVLGFNVLYCPRMLSASFDLSMKEQQKNMTFVVLMCYFHNDVHFLQLCTGSF